MSELASCVFVTMPTSGTGSLWRIITAIAGSHYKVVKIAEQMETAGKSAEIPNWVPEPHGHLYMYNTPHFVNKNLRDTQYRLITNFRDPRDLACNQYYWALQHPIANRSEEYIENFRRKVKENGIDAFVLQQNNDVLFNSLRDLSERLQTDEGGVLKLSYAQLCLDFDNLLHRLVAFLGVPSEGVPWTTLEKERTVNLSKNPQWIGQAWAGSDIMPGRYKKELKAETIAALDAKYKEHLKFLRSLEQPQLRVLLATEAEAPEMSRVLVGGGDEMFLRNDAANSADQITGLMQLSYSQLATVGMAHRCRKTYGDDVGHFTYLHALIPSKAVVYRDQLPEELAFEQHGPRPWQQYVDAKLDRLWAPFYDPHVLDSSAEERYFPKTDSHWSHAGAIKYLRAFFAKESPELLGRLETVPFHRFSGKQRGDLGTKVESAIEQIEIVAPEKSWSNLIFENGITNDGGIRWYKNSNLPNGGIAFILHDSSSLWLLGVLPELFSETVFLYGSTFDYGFLQSLKPDFVLCLQTERFFPTPGKNGGSVVELVTHEERLKNTTHTLAEYLSTDSRFATASA